MSKGFLKNRAGSSIASNQATSERPVFDADGKPAGYGDLQKNINMGSSDSYTKPVGAVLGSYSKPDAADYQG